MLNISILNVFIFLCPAHTVCQNRLRGHLQNERHLQRQREEKGEEKEGSRASYQRNKEASIGEHDNEFEPVQMLRGKLSTQSNTVD